MSGLLLIALMPPTTRPAMTGEQTMNILIWWLCAFVVWTLIWKAMSFVRECRQQFQPNQWLSIGLRTMLACALLSGVVVGQTPITVANVGTGEPVLAPGAQFVARTTTAFIAGAHTCADQAFPNYPREWAGVTGELAGTSIEVWCVSSQAIQGRVSVLAGSRITRHRVSFSGGVYPLTLKTPLGEFYAVVRLAAAAPGILEQGVPHNAWDAPYGLGGIWLHAPGPGAMGFLVPPIVPVLVDGGTYVQVWCTGVTGAVTVMRRDVVLGGRVLPASLHPTGFAGLDALRFEIPGDMAGIGEVELRLKIHTGLGYMLSPPARLILQ